MKCIAWMDTVGGLHATEVDALKEDFLHGCRALLNSYGRELGNQTPSNAVYDVLWHSGDEVAKLLKLRDRIRKLMAKKT